MEKRLNLRSTLIGAVLGVTVMVALGASVILEEVPPVAERFRLVNGGYQKMHLYKIDTMTGQVWETSAENPRAEFLVPNVNLIAED